MPKIMVVDDNQFMRKRIAKVLGGKGYEVVEASDGDEAVKMFKMSRPDASLLDVVMPNKDGLEALQEIRDIDRRAKVVMLTALSQQAVMVKAVQLGAKDFLTKPVVPDKLLDTLNKLLG